MALQDILKKILQEADVSIESLQAELQNQKAELDKASTAQEAQEAADLKDKTEKALASIETKTTSMARRENNQRLLTVKRDLIARCLEAFLASLEEADDATYQSVLKALFAKVNATGTALVPESRLKASEAVAPKGVTVKADKDIKGGFILKTDHSEINNTFHELVYAEYRSELEMYFANQLKLV